MNEAWFDDGPDWPDKDVDKPSAFEEPKTKDDDGEDEDGINNEDCER